MVKIDGKTYTLEYDGRYVKLVDPQTGEVLVSQPSWRGLDELIANAQLRLSRQRGW
jgi:hypothetical protein